LRGGEYYLDGEVKILLIDTKSHRTINQQLQDLQMSETDETFTETWFAGATQFSLYEKPLVYPCWYQCVNVSYRKLLKLWLGGCFLFLLVLDVLIIILELFHSHPILKGSQMMTWNISVEQTLICHVPNG
jgi:hypothetical protein